jgi:hypothetical protein
VPERAIITDDSQEASIIESKAADSEKGAGSSDEISESEQVFGSSHTNSSPPAASLDKRKRKGSPNEENSGESKLSQTAAEESTPEEFDPFGTAAVISS